MIKFFIEDEGITREDYIQNTNDNNKEKTKRYPKEKSGFCSKRIINLVELDK